jgi:hypothetical protein
LDYDKQSKAKPAISNEIELKSNKINDKTKKKLKIKKILCDNKINKKR